MLIFLSNREEIKRKEVVLYSLKSGFYDVLLCAFCVVWMSIAIRTSYFICAVSALGKDTTLLYLMSLPTTVCRVAETALDNFIFQSLLS